MGLLQNWTDWAENKGDALAGFETQLTTKVSEFICDTYNNKVGAFLLNPFAKGFIKNKCSLIDKAPAPPLVIESGQGGCSCVNYDVFAEYTSLNNSKDPVLGRVRIQGRFAGMAKSVAFDDGESLIEDDKVKYYACNNNVENGLIRSVTIGRSTINRSEPEGEFTFRRIYFVRVDGQPDDCLPPVELTEEEKTTTIQINNYDSSNNLVSDTEYNVSFNAVSNIKFPIILDVGGVNISFGSDGLREIDSDENSGDDGVPGDTSGDGNPDNNPNDSITYNTENKVTVKNYRPPNSETYDLETEENVEEKEEVLEPGRIAYVLVEISSLPVGGRHILFEDEENNTYFAGYIAWIDLVAGIKYRREEIPIRKKYNSFPVPLTASGYIVYSVNGAKLKVESYREPIEE